MKEDQNYKTAFGSQNSRDTHRHEISFPSQNWSLEMLLRRLKAIDARRDDKFASVMDAIGEFGTFQWRLVVLTFIPSILSTFFIFSHHFLLTAQRPYCNTSWILEVGPNLTEDEQLNLTLPRAPNGSFLTCLMYIPVPWDLDSIIHFGLNYTETCKFGWIYPFAHTRSLINEFDLVCGNEPNKENGLTVFLSGVLTGSLLFGFLSDKLGRYPIILLSLLGFLIFGFGTAFVSSFYQYLFFRFFVAQASVGYAICSVSLVMEWLVGEHRAQAVILQHSFLTIGVILLTGLAYKVVHWRLLCLLGGMPMFPLICNIWVLRESPRWLMVRGKVEEAKKVLCYAAEVNKKTIPLNLLNELQISGKKVAKASILDFCTNQHLFKVVLAIGCVWFTVSYISFTLNLKMNDFGLDVYFVQMVRSIVAVPARLCCIILLEYFGRKWALNLTLFLVTSMCLFLLFLPQEPKSTIILTLMLAEFSMAGTLSIFFIYTAELLPTVLRSTGLGMVSLAWVAGAISSVAIFKQTKTQLPIFFCCLCCVLALCFSSLVPETGSQSLRDSIEYNIRDSIEPKDRNKDVPMVIAEESMSDIVADSEVTNTTLNAVTFKPEENSLLNMTLEVPKMDLPVQSLKAQPP
ncbi:solute carrier family 22 member 14 isoform X1 [Mus musculus]|uniref:Solute carrier family 22 member 14 n=2 Tax=Mus musculus TaxID=10090 RepID=S22AE_MOUSE|nr:solute carrier family 22 member 14 [Mus musculus]NP_001397565.1 solute carrier family 22 member 14 [Mus musculus]XP_011241283.1 solute carrier family 22 member 14 isoform X1 [Mus musculus]XP_011241284.1 solute carrier family 22 member 14 isoform X1 [Mus musculus]XP_011241285.1 solute carrier family 22 member 14 isoform X1 [Mus musculus]Q497L9.1 RecName: Full=Solute carrier family 22 member 14 [Mus musculus]AAI00472.1 Solute carrier family 22 (organic cation transporter), member 14 [Mus mus|eukprot:NP_001032838.1 solute carrier family 22 member 14 [Mus musculus]